MKAYFRNKRLSPSGFVYGDVPDPEPSRGELQIEVKAATGGVGHFAVQIARAKGAIVTASCSPANQSLAQQLGANEAFALAMNGRPRGKVVVWM